MLFAKTLDINVGAMKPNGFLNEYSKSNLDNTFEQTKHDDTTKQAQNPFTNTKIIVSKDFETCRCVRTHPFFS
jgi:hypothetical protein